MGLWDSLNKYGQAGMRELERSAERSAKNIEAKVKEKIRRMSDLEFERFYRNRYNNDQLMDNPNILSIVENEAWRRGIR